MVNKVVRFVNKLLLGVFALVVVVIAFGSWVSPKDDAEQAQAQEQEQASGEETMVAPTWLRLVGNEL